MRFPRAVSVSQLPSQQQPVPSNRVLNDFSGVWDAINAIRVSGHAIATAVSGTQTQIAQFFPQCVEHNRNIVLAPPGWRQGFPSPELTVPNTQDRVILPPSQPCHFSPAHMEWSWGDLPQRDGTSGSSCQAQNGDGTVNHVCKGLKRGLWFCAERTLWSLIANVCLFTSVLESWIWCFHDKQLHNTENLDMFWHVILLLS